MTDEDNDYINNLFNIQEDGYMDQLMALEGRASLGALGLEEVQNKFGISGGLALAQYNNYQLGLNQEASQIVGNINNLEIEKELFTSEYKDAKEQGALDDLLFQANMNILGNQARQEAANASILEYQAANPSGIWGEFVEEDEN